MARRGWKLWPGVMMASCLLASSALAAPEDPAAAGRYAALVRQGAQAAKDKRWDACVAALTEAVQIEGAPLVLGDLGLCEEQAGRFARAYSHLWRAMEAAPANTQQEPWKRYEAAIVRLRERVVLLIVTTEPSNARVIVDGVPFGQGDGQTIPVEPGRHTVAGRLDGYEDKVVQTDDLRAGAIPNIQITLKPKPRAPSSPVKLPSSSSGAPAREAPLNMGRLLTPAWSPRGVLVTAAYVGTAALLVSGATAIGFQVHWESMRSSLETKGFQSDTCGAPASPAVAADCEEIDTRLHQRATSANVLIGSAIGLAALSGAAGLAMYLDRGPSRPTMTATVSTNGGGIVLRGKW